MMDSMMASCQPGNENFLFIRQLKIMEQKAGGFDTDMLTHPLD